MSKTSLIITSTAEGKVQQKAITDVNPAVSNEKLAQFATKLVALTNNTYQKADRVFKSNCDTETYTPGDSDSGSLKEVPPLSVSPTTLTTDASTSASATITYDGGGTLYLYDFDRAGLVASLNGKTITVSALKTASAGQYTFKVGATASSTYLAANPVTITVNVTAVSDAPPVVD